MRIQSLVEVTALRTRILQTCDQTVGNLAALCSEDGTGLEKLRALRFDKIGTDPLEGTPLNFTEQINQAFTWLTALRALEILHQQHPGVFPCDLNPGNIADGHDIQSASGDLAAETFAAVRLTNNKKLEKDLAKMGQATSSHRYVFFHCPGYAEGRHRELESEEGVEVWAVDIGTDHKAV